MSFGDHLRADQDTGLPAVHAVHDGFELTGSAGAIAIQAHQCFGREHLTECLLHTFGALTHRLDGEAATRAAFRQSFRMATVMTAQLLLRAVYRQPCVAVRT